MPTQYKPQMPKNQQGVFCIITLTKLNGVPFVLNCDLIETVQENPDTTIHLVNGGLHIVRESMQEVVERTTRYKQRLYTKMTEGEWRGER